METCDSPEDPRSPLVVIFVVIIIGLECIIGITTNGFIVAASVAQWVQNKVVHLSGRILIFLSLSRIALQSIMMLDIILSSIFPQFYMQDVVYDAFKISFMFLNYCSLWFAAWLSFFYFVKISDFSHPLFLKLKWKIPRWMPWLLWLSVFKSLGFSVFFCTDIYAISCSNTSVPCFNSTEKDFVEASMIILVLFYNLGILFPLSMFILAATLLIISLRRHTLHMQGQASGSRDPSTQAHRKAIASISYFLILYVFNAFSLFLYTYNITDTHSVRTILCKIIMAAYPAGHSILQILDNSSLRRSWKQFLHRAHLHLAGQSL
ncbi:PREDICTED: taste receptor type 2 member 39-like [Elephantulus edwardii]|uniref:taste receptor type 2 member 39-like n=1 Tax=Elephantulus edwardii TaxID=28737 RepID=UPI0003F0CABF|nr:PREDICTED: taste receptor type 2 member 39-like [Elephantulus edwardii]